MTLLNPFTISYIYTLVSDSTGILVVERPCGTVINVKELFGSESKSQVYAHLHNLFQKSTMDETSECLFLK